MMSEAAAFILPVKAALNTLTAFDDGGEYKLYEGSAYELVFEDDFDGRCLTVQNGQKLPNGKGRI